MLYLCSLIWRNPKTNSMKKILFLTTILLTQFAYSQVVDVFNYTGALSSNGWSTHSGTAGQMITSTGSLSYTGLAASTGNKAVFSEFSSEDVNIPITIAGDTAYVSFVVSIMNTSDLSSSGDYFMGIGAAAGASAGALYSRIYVKTGVAANTVNFGIGNASGAATFDVVDYPLNTPIFIAVSLDKNASPALAQMYINPVPGAAMPATPTISNSVNTSAVTAFASIYLRQGANTGNLEVDEIRAGSTYAAVTPAGAAGCSLTASGLAALTCNDAGTGSITLDDYLTFDLNPTGTTLGANYSVSVSSGTITPTTGTYGAATSFQLQAGSAGAGNVVVTITDNGTSGCTMTENITDPGACSSANPVITMTPSSLTGFDHIVGTPSSEQTFMVGGLGLTADITLNAPTNFEISSTTGAGFTTTLTLPQTAGVVAPTTIYVRGNATTMGAFNGDIIGVSAGADNDTVSVSGMADDYVYSTIDLISTVDSDGIAVSLDQLVEITGVVYCMDFDGNAGYSITLIDGSMEGINLFGFADVSGYTSPMEGDSLRVFGVIEQFNGLLEIVADSIEVLAQGVATMSPTVVTTLDESTESQYIKMNNLTFVTPIATFPSGSTNIDVTDGTNTFVIRIDSDTDIPGGAAPQGTFSVIGVGGQFDNSAPYTEGYQLFPCSLASFEQSTSGLDENTLLHAIRVYPNPVVDVLTINNSLNATVTFDVVDINGKVISSENSFAQSTTISTSNWTKGVYFVRFSSESATAVVKIVK